MPLTNKQVRQLLLQKFKFQAVEGTKHDAVAFSYGGKKVATTRFSRRSGQEIGDTLLKLIAQQVQVDSLKFCKDMINCTNSYEDYLKSSRKRALLRNEADC